MDDASNLWRIRLHPTRMKTFGSCRTMPQIHFEACKQSAFVSPDAAEIGVCETDRSRNWSKHIRYEVNVASSRQGKAKKRELL